MSVRLNAIVRSGVTMTATMIAAAAAMTKTTTMIAAAADAAAMTTMTTTLDLGFGLQSENGGALESAAVLH